MKLARRLSPLGLVALLLAGCAPAAIGTSPASPYPSGSSAIATAPGGTVYLEAHYTFADFSIDPAKLTGVLWVPTGYDAQSAIVTTKFVLGDEQVPRGWKLELVQVQATRTTVAGPKSFSKSTEEYTLTVLLAVTAKEKAMAGPYHLSVMLRYQQRSKPIRIGLRVARGVP